MGDNSFGTLFSFTSFGESHGPAIGCVVDGVPPRLNLSESDIQPYLDRRKPGQSRFVTQRRETDQVKILSGTFEGKTTGTPVMLLIENTDQRTKDYSAISESYRPGHADYTYDQKYGHRDYRGGGRSSARETAVRVAAGGIADGAGMAAVFAAGAEGIQMGTRFVSSLESPVHDNFKNKIINSGIDGTYILNKKSKPVIRALKTDLTKDIDEKGEMDMTALMNIKDLYFGGDMEAAPALSGQSSGLIDEIKPVKQIIDEIVKEFNSICDSMSELKI